MYPLCADWMLVFFKAAPPAAQPTTGPVGFPPASALRARGADQHDQYMTPSPELWLKPADGTRIRRQLVVVARV
ncbi:hypothetical protein GCM10018952_31240 [Streptosporangium vulgare]